MILEIFFHFLYVSSELIFEELKKLIWTENFPAHFCISLTIAIKAKALIIIYKSSCTAETKLQNRLFEDSFDF
jgi:hypothetical protein